MPFGIQPIHILIIIIVALLIFGPKKLPDMGRNPRKAITEFRKGAKGLTDGFRDELVQPSATAGQTIQPPAAFIPESSTATTPSVLTPSQMPSTPAAESLHRLSVERSAPSRFDSLGSRVTRGRTTGFNTIPGMCVPQLQLAAH